MIQYDLCNEKRKKINSTKVVLKNLNDKIFFENIVSLAISLGWLDGN